MVSFREYLSAFPLVAILRGFRPDEAAAIGEALVEAGFRIIEVPLNSPEPLRSIEIAGAALRPGGARRRRHGARSGGRRSACATPAAGSSSCRMATPP